MGKYSVCVCNIWAYVVRLDLAHCSNSGTHFCVFFFFTHWLYSNFLLVCSLTHSFIHPLVHSFTCLLSCSHPCLPAQSYYISEFLFYLEHEGSSQDAIIEYKQTHTILCVCVHIYGSTCVMHKYGEHSFDACYTTASSYIFKQSLECKWKGNVVWEWELDKKAGWETF